MFSIRGLSIKSKLIGIQMFTCLLVLGLCFVAFLISSIKGYKERKVRSAESIAQVIGSNSVSAIQFLDNEAATKILENFQQVQTDVVNASILDKSGNVFATYTKKDYSTYHFPAPYVNSYQFEGDSLLYVYRNISKDKELFGTVCLQIQLTELQQIKQLNYTMTALLLIIGMLFSFIVAYINQRSISKPILSLVNVMEEIRNNGDYGQQVPVAGKDEISTLSAEFNSLLKEIVSSHQKKDEFIGVASHELKTPLTTIKGFLELLDEIETEETKRIFVQKALSGTRKLQDLIVDLLDVSKIQSGQLQLNIKQFNIDELVDECINNMQISTHKHMIVKNTLPVDQFVLADRHRIEQVIVNFVSNAIKYSADGKEILVGIKKTDPSIIVSVKDFGLGISAEELGKIFDRFYRAPGKSVGISGFGLGLYICSQIIKLHNGKIWAESKEGEGSVFYFELPINNV
ncbi:ATP-binding protein [Ferruginibacter albus]|uniref:ATP-binding protein n=1 Tax=Ferruginibacter albus TaxID=2875540 RepID=UPI001CC56D08|nr:ATP-binding protein [Ferruginibacter albus]UAY51077.1 HAMP domain-containing protein [Ferruginibacter albus]